MIYAIPCQNCQLYIKQYSDQIFKWQLCYIPIIFIISTIYEFSESLCILFALLSLISLIDLIKEKHTLSWRYNETNLKDYLEWFQEVQCERRSRAIFCQHCDLRQKKDLLLI